jgi:hypothetical protein
MVCSDCALVQQANDNALELLVNRVYSQYQPTYGSSERVSDYMAYFLEESVKRTSAPPGSRLIEIGSNDGSLLATAQARGFDPIGFEPSESLNRVAAARGVKVIHDYFGLEAAKRYLEVNPPAEIVVTRHTLEHAFDPVDFLSGISIVLATGGLAAIEVPYVRLQMINNQFPSMTFQHRSFFSVLSMRHALERAGLALIDVSFVEMDGGSMIAYAAKGPTHAQEPSPEAVLRYEENTLRLREPAAYERFFADVAQQRIEIRRYFESLVSDHYQILGYGAGSKGQALLNMLGCDEGHIHAVIDDTPGIAGKYIPGTGIAVVASSDARVSDRTIVFVTAPTHAREIANKGRMKWGSRTAFLSIAPQFHYVTGA